MCSVKSYNEERTVIFSILQSKQSCLYRTLILSGIKLKFRQNYIHTKGLWAHKCHSKKLFTQKCKVMNENTIKWVKISLLLFDHWKDFQLGEQTTFFSRTITIQPIVLNSFFKILYPFIYILCIQIYFGTICVLCNILLKLTLCQNVFCFFFAASLRRFILFALQHKRSFSKYFDSTPTGRLHQNQSSFQQTFFLHQCNYLPSDKLLLQSCNEDSSKI